MNTLDPNASAALLSMPAEDLYSFVREAVRERQLHVVVNMLNQQALSKTDPNAECARQALDRLGFGH